MTSLLASLDRRVLVGVGVLTVVAVLALVVRPLLFGGGDDAGFEQLEIGAAAPSGEPVPTEEPTTEPELVPETFEVFSARDPFQQLVPSGSTSAEGTTVAASGTGTSATPDTAADTAGTDGGSAPVDGSTDSAPAAVGATQVQLVETEADSSDEVVVSVNGTAHRAAAGEVFADRFRVLDVDGDCAALLFGDSRFSLCEGESITK